MQMLSSSLSETNRSAETRPFFSICIPQYNRTDFLVKACMTFLAQRFKDFELCISDDCSNDGKELSLLECLRRSGLVFTYSRTATNFRYDVNLRNAISLSAGRYLLLMGNDDGLSDPETLQFLHDELIYFQPVAAAITNYREHGSGQVYRRMTKTGVLGKGPDFAVEVFRNYSFVSGVVLEGDAARKSASDAIDGSEMYQMYLGTRVIAAGGKFLGIDRVCVDKDLQIAGQVVDSYRTKPRLRPCPIVERPLPMGRLLEVVAAGLAPYHVGAERERHLIQVARQLYQFTYPFWVVEYRRVQSWRYAFGVLLALSPTRICKGLPLSWFARLRLWLTYLMIGVVALSVPIGSFDALRPRLYAIAKRYKI
jgi:hypothetical protein